VLDRLLRRLGPSGFVAIADSAISQMSGVPYARRDGKARLLPLL
jgi:hypothetical protein